MNGVAKPVVELMIVKSKLTTALVALIFAVRFKSTFVNVTRMNQNKWWEMNFHLCIWVKRKVNVHGSFCSFQTKCSLRFQVFDSISSIYQRELRIFQFMHKFSKMNSEVCCFSAATNWQVFVAVDFHKFAVQQKLCTRNGFTFTKRFYSHTCSSTCCY